MVVDRGICGVEAAVLSRKSLNHSTSEQLNLSQTHTAKRLAIREKLPETYLTSRRPAALQWLRAQQCPTTTGIDRVDKPGAGHAVQRGVHHRNIL